MELTEDNFDVEINRNQVIITFLGEKREIAKFLKTVSPERTIK